MTARLVRCPQCGGMSEYRVDNPARPFCSPRCKLMDLGAWAEGRYAISGLTNRLDETGFEEVAETRDDTIPTKPRPVGN